MAALLPHADAGGALMHGDWLLLESDTAMPLAHALLQHDQEAPLAGTLKYTLSLQSVAQALLEKWGDRTSRSVWRPSEQAAHLDWAFQEAVQTLWASPQDGEAAANPGTTIDTLALGDCPASVPPALLQALQFGVRRLLVGYQGVILEGTHPLWLACLFPQGVAQNSRGEAPIEDTLHGIGLYLWPEQLREKAEALQWPGGWPADTTLMDWGYYLVQGQAQGQTQGSETRWQPTVTPGAESPLVRLGRIPWSDDLWQDPVTLAAQALKNPSPLMALQPLRQALWQTLARRNWPESYSPWLRAAQHQLPG